MALGKRLKKMPVLCQVSDGFIGNRMLEPYIRQAYVMLEEGASIQAIDQAIEQFGFAMGPFRMGDLAGNDIGYAIAKRREQAGDTHAQVARTLANQLVDMKRLGQKTGAGWYDYLDGDGRQPVPSSVVNELVSQTRQALGITPRVIASAEIVERLVYALVNEAAYLLAEGIAAKASDVDMVYLMGYGFPPARGGPLFYASQVGLPRVVLALEEQLRNPYAARGMKPIAPLLQRLAAEGKTFF
jgi:3-hydroxyacyl-CoA dehydrogenase